MKFKLWLVCGSIVGAVSATPTVPVQCIAGKDAQKSYTLCWDMNTWSQKSGDMEIIRNRSKKSWTIINHKKKALWDYSDSLIFETLGRRKAALRMVNPTAPKEQVHQPLVMTGKFKNNVTVKDNGSSVVLYSLDTQKKPGYFFPLVWVQRELDYMGGQPTWVREVVINRELQLALVGKVSVASKASWIMEWPIKPIAPTAITIPQEYAKQAIVWDNLEEKCRKEAQK